MNNFFSVDDIYICSQCGSYTLAQDFLLLFTRMPALMILLWKLDIN